MKINRYFRYKMIEKIEKNVVVRIIYTYNFKNYKILIKESFFFFSKVKPLTKKCKNK